MGVASPEGGPRPVDSMPALRLFGTAHPHPALPHKGRIQRGRLTPTIAILALAAIPRPAIADDQPEGLARVEVVKTPDGGIQPQAVADGRGTVHLLFFRGDPMHGDLFYAKRNPGQTGGFLLPIRVNSEAGSAIATGTIRGGQIALGPKGKVHVAWNGSTATPSALSADAVQPDQAGRERIRAPEEPDEAHHGPRRRRHGRGRRPGAGLRRLARAA